MVTAWDDGEPLKADVEFGLDADVPTDESVCAATMVPDVIEAAEESAEALPLATEEGASEAGGAAEEDAGRPPPVDELAVTADTPLLTTADEAGGAAEAETGGSLVDEFATTTEVESAAEAASAEEGSAEEGALDTTTEVETAAETASAEDGGAEEGAADVTTTEVTGAEVTTAADAEATGADVAGAEVAAAEVMTAATDEGFALDAAAVADAWPLGVMGELKSAVPCGSGRMNPDGKRLPFAPLKVVSDTGRTGQNWSRAGLSVG